MRKRRHHAPDRTRPGDIARTTRDHVDVQLRHQIAQCCDIELVAFGDLFQGARDPGNFRHQLRLFDLVEIDDLHGLGPARHQQQPGVMRILDDQHAAQRQVADVDGIFLELVCEALASADLGMEWGCFLRPRNVNRELLALMQRAGLKHLEFGSDTLSEPLMKSYGKSFTWEEVRSSSLFAHELGIHYSHFIIFGGPGETPDTIEETLHHSKELTGSFYFGTIGMRIYPETPLWRHCAPEKNGETSADYLLTPRFYVEPPLTTQGIFERLRRHREVNHNWVVGDPPQGFNETIEKLRRRGARGPMWEYVELLQRMSGEKAG